MADGHAELTEYPMVYLLRHMPRGRKQAASSVVGETQVVRLPSWTGQQAPLVGHATDRNDVTTSYRAARGGDGVVRLVAAIESRAFEQAWRTHDNPHPADHSSTRIFRTSLPDWEDRDPIAAASPAIGPHLSSNRAQAVHHAELLRPGMVLVDGVLHAQCWEPGWEFDFRHNIGYKIARTLPPPGSYNFVGFCADPLQRLRELDEDADSRVLPGRRQGQITEEINGAFGDNADWHQMCILAQVIHICAHKSSHNMTAAEFSMVPGLNKACLLWPRTVDMELARRLATMTRVLHAISPSNVSDLLDKVNRCMARMAARVPQLDLETRLELAGCTIPTLPGAHAPMDAVPEENLGQIGFHHG